MATPEGRVKNRVKALLGRYPNVYQHWPVQAGYGKPCLDCHGCANGYYFAIETKAPGKHPTPRQEVTIEEIRASGGAVFVVGEKLTDKTYSGMEELEAWLESV